LDVIFQSDLIVSERSRSAPMTATSRRTLMHVSTLVQYLFGNRQAIAEVAACPLAVWLGLLLVISAGFAREYDGEDLLHEPWHVLLPLAASLLTSFLLFLLVETAFSRGRREPGQAHSLLAKYRAFLGLYWMTAPLAWLYAVPVERFLDAADAVAANLWMLGIVSLWRVALMTRVVSVVYARPPLAAFLVVMLFADSLVLAIVWLTPLPILSIMGGIRLTESEAVIQATQILVGLAATLTWPFWAVGTLAVGMRGRRAAAEPSESRSAPSESRGIAWELWALAAFSIVLWAAALPFTQGEQQNRRLVENDLRSGHIEHAVRFMSQRERGDFPPHWDPPPRIGYGESSPPLVDVLLELDRAGAAPWVRELFREKLAVQSEANAGGFHGHPMRLGEMDDERLARYARLLKSLPEGPEMARYHEYEIHVSFHPQNYPPEDLSGPKTLSAERRATLEEILNLIPDNSRRFEPASDRPSPHAGPD
jgi:hypothetical protein